MSKTLRHRDTLISVETTQFYRLYCKVFYFIIPPPGNYKFSQIVFLCRRACYPPLLYNTIYKEGNSRVKTTPGTSRTLFPPFLFSSFFSRPFRVAPTRDKSFLSRFLFSSHPPSILPGSHFHWEIKQTLSTNSRSPFLLRK